jgi:hypothetical protein
MADTSYSDMNAADNRGKAVSTVDLHNGGTVTVSGVLHDGKTIRYTLQPKDAYNLVGKLELDEDGLDRSEARFVKARLAETGDLLMCRHEGFKVEYSTITCARSHVA